MRPTLEALSLSVDGTRIEGIRHRDRTEPSLPVLLCLHGWLDNASSFVPMMPFLPAFDVVSIDLPGHGYSDPLPQGYAAGELCYQLTRIIEAIGCAQCHVVGHSLGGSIAPMLAVANPAIVQSLTMIDASGPLSEEAMALPARMVRSLQDRLQPERFSSRLFASKADAVRARLKATRMEKQSARLIIDRQLLKVADGYRWRFDPRWRMASPQYQTEDQVREVLRAVSCRTLTIIAEDGYLASRPETEDRLNCLQSRYSVTLPGHHHLHMDNPEPVATAINRFLNAVPNLGG